MDAGSSFWPKINDVCNLAGCNEMEKFVVIDIRREFPVNMYLVKSRNTGEVHRTFRHQLFRAPIQEKTKPSGILTASSSTDTDTYLAEVQELISQGFFDDDMTFEETVPETDHMEAIEIMPLDDRHTTSDLDEDELDEIDKSAKSKGTIRNETWAMKKFTDWQKRRNLTYDLQDIPTHELALALRKFYAEVRTSNGQPLAPPSLRGIRAGLHRAITSPPINRAINIIDDPEFQAANKTFENVCKQYQAQGNAKQKHFPAIEQEDLQKVGVYLSKYKEAPEILLHTFWFLLCYHFARRGREGFRELEKRSFEVKKDDKGLEYLVGVSTEKSKNWQGGSSSKAWDYSDVRAYGIKFDTGLSLNIVDVFKFYMSKLNPTNEALFQKPKTKWQGCETWFTNTVVGKNKLATIMQMISAQAKLSVTYTNHSVRATSISVMYHGGVDVKHICKLTKHKSEESLKHYIDGQTSEQKRRCTEVLAKGLFEKEVENPQATEAHTITDDESNSLMQTESSTQITNQQINMNSLQNFKFPTMNFNVTGGNCSFHFHCGDK